MPHLHLLVLDTETTGFVPKVHRVMEVACVRIEDGKKVAELDQLLSLPPDHEIPSAIERLTHIKTSDLVGQPTFEEILPKLEKLLTPETVIVGQNVQFDLGMLRGEGWDLTQKPWTDTSMLASLVFPDLESFSLGFMSDVLKLDHTPRHRALGDVNATLQLLEKCVERLLELPEKDLEILRAIAEKGPEGYRKFFGALGISKVKKRPTWLKAGSSPLPASAPSPSPSPGSRPAARDSTSGRGETNCVSLLEEPLTASFLPSVVAGLSGSMWLAVKNLESQLRRIALPKDVITLTPPEFLLSRERVELLSSQPVFTADEMTLAMKLCLYEPTLRTDLPLHGGEYQTWTGKLACTKDSPEYQKLLKKALGGSALVSHQHLLTLLADPDLIFPKDFHLMIDDASMLEDTATAAFAWVTYLPTIRAASQGNKLLTQCVDVIELWTERVRNDLDLRYLAPSDLESRESTELKGMVADVLKAELPSSVRSALEALLLILDPANLPGRITWIESMMDGSKTVKSVPEDIAALLKDRLFSRVPVTLFVPPKSAAGLRAILSPDLKLNVEPCTEASAVTVSLPVGENIESVLSRREGKTILLVSSKRMIEDVYVKYSEKLEAAGVTLICQGFAGGQGRMQAEFEVAASPAFLVMTPWMYEGMELPAATVHRLVLQTFPFDHPSHAVVSRRALRYRDGFGEYSLPRVKHRLFRLLRAFAKHATADGEAVVLDERLRTKAYGKQLADYLKSLSAPTKVQSKDAPAAKQMRLL